MEQNQLIIMTQKEARDHFINCGRANRFRTYFDQIIKATPNKT